MWSDQRPISDDSEEGGEEHSPAFPVRSELTRVLRCVGATETEPGRSGERKEGASGCGGRCLCECATLTRRRRLVPAGCRRLGLATSFKSHKNLVSVSVLLSGKSVQGNYGGSPRILKWVNIRRISKKPLTPPNHPSRRQKDVESFQKNIDICFVYIFCFGRRGIPKP